jgi:hypothetical protein
MAYAFRSHCPALLQFDFVHDANLLYKCTLIFGTEPLPDMVGCYISLHRAYGGHTVSISRVSSLFRF